MNERNVFRDYVGSCDWNVGALFAHDGFIFMLHDTCVHAGIPFPIEYVFGSVPCLLQGGRAAPFDFSDADVRAIFDRYAQAGVGCRLTFSNSDVQPEDLSDRRSNFLLEYLNRGKNNGVIVTSDLLAGYIRDTYPNLQLISSLVKPTVENTLGEETPDYYNALFDTYDIVVVNPARSHDDEFLSAIEHKDRVEFIANHRCRPNCFMSHDHYVTQTKAARAASTGMKDDQETLENELRRINSACLEIRRNNPCENNLISTARVSELIDSGFVHFKIEGRDYPAFVIVRDIGNWIFEPEGPYLSMAQSVLNSPI